MANTAEQQAMIEGTPPRFEASGRHPRWRATSRLGCLSVYRVELLYCVSMHYVRRGL
jgi:hypothetical protein